MKEAEIVNEVRCETSRTSKAWESIEEHKR